MFVRPHVFPSVSRSSLKNPADILLKDRVLQNHCPSLSFAIRTTSSKGKGGGFSGSDGTFRPRRRTPRSYRPAIPGIAHENRIKKRSPRKNQLAIGFDEFGDPYQSEPIEVDGKPLIFDHDDELTRTVGPHMASAIKQVRREKDRPPMDDFDPVEAELRVADYFTAEAGSTEDLVGDRRAMAGFSMTERMELDQKLDKFIEDRRHKMLKPEDDEWDNEEDDDDDDDDPDIEDEDNPPDPNQQAFGDWSEALVKVNRVQKVQRGGTRVQYRALLIAGNGNGCAGFGVAKAGHPNDAVIAASRMAKRNIFFIDRYLNSGLTSDLAGRHNSCRVQIRAKPPNSGLTGNILIQQIMLFFGVADCSSKTHGNRNPFNVVRATFKAVLAHESMEEIAMKTGKRYMTVQRARRLGI